MFAWNAETDARLIKLLETESRQDAADTLGCHLGTVKRAIKRLGIKYKKKTGSNYKLLRSWPDEFTPEQNEILVGSMLGDGTITDRSPHFRMKQARVFREYVVWFHEAFRVYMTDLIHDSTGMCRGKVIESSMAITRTAPRFVTLRQKWYPEGIKIVPRDIRLTPRLCAHWHVQDGQNRQNKREAALNTNSFTKDDVEFLVERLRLDVGIKSHCRRKSSNKDQWVIIFGNQYGDEGYFQFLDLVRPHIPWECFQYKANIALALKKSPRHTGPKLNMNKAREIRALYATGKYTQRIVGDMFGVTSGIVSQIVNHIIHAES